MRIGMAVVGILLFVSVLIARLPLSLLVENAPVPVDYRSVSGTIWNGRIAGIEVDGQEVGDAEIGLRFFPLLTARVSTALALRGRFIDGLGDVSFDGTTLAIRDATGTADVSRFGLVDVFGQPLRGTIEGSIDRLEFSRTEGCLHAELDLATDALTQSLGIYAGDGLELVGKGRCENGDLVIPLDGENDDAVIEVELRLKANGRYHSVLAVTPLEPRLGDFLGQVGFRKEGNTYVAERGGSVEEAL